MKAINIIRVFVKLTTTLLLFNWSQFAQAQKETEIYIPIGESPGISGIVSVTGTIDSIFQVSLDSFVVTLKGGISFRTNTLTTVYLDKSLIPAKNEKGSLSGLSKNQFIEIKFRGNDPSEAAEWIKIRIPK